MLSRVIIVLTIAALLRSAFAVPPARSRAVPGVEVTDEVSGQITSISYAKLSRLPQISTRLQPDENFAELSPKGNIVTGVDLGLLLDTFAGKTRNIALVATCRDGYVSPFPRSAIAAHHPILALRIDGLITHDWAIKHHSYDPGPYFVTYANFRPAFHVLAHTDYPQHPAEIIRLKIVRGADLFRAIAPHGFDRLPADSPVLSGLRIAEQNCFRCHNMGTSGGTKANVSWKHLAEVAKTRPDYFARWVQNPQAVRPKTEMPANLQYDQRTLDALTRYFQAIDP